MGRACVLPSPAALERRTALPRAADGRCACRRAASCAEHPPPQALPGIAPARTPSATRGPQDPPEAAAAAGSRPDLGSTRPRYLIRSTRVQVLFSFPLRQRHRVLRGAAQVELAQRLPGSARMAASGVPHLRRDRRQRDAERARKSVTPSVVQLGEVQRAVFRLRGVRFDAWASCARCSPSHSPWSGSRQPPSRPLLPRAGGS
jgi:hypothetical protein